MNRIRDAICRYVVQVVQIKYYRCFRLDGSHACVGLHDLVGLLRALCCYDYFYEYFCYCYSHYTRTD